MQRLAPEQEFQLAHHYHGLGRLGDAQVLCQRVLAAQPHHLGALEMLAGLHPEHADLQTNLATALFMDGQLEKALNTVRRALALKPSSHEALNTLGLIYQRQDRLDEAEAAFRQAVQVKPDEAGLLNNLGIILQEKRDYHQAIVVYRRALAVRPDLPETQANLANALSQNGALEESLRLYRRSLSLRQDPRAASMYLFSLHLHSDIDPIQIRDEHVWWDRTYARPLARPAPAFSIDGAGDRKLRIGYVTPDFNENPVGRFMLPLLAGHDRAHFEIFCYSDARRTDANTERLRGHADFWRETSALSDQRLAEQVRADRIDVLVDLVMHAGGSRLLAFAQKPAPVQVTYLSYCSTTGLNTMDYRISDPYLDPPDADETVYVEKTVRLPRTFWCFQPPACTSDVQLPPAEANGYVTFGCFNNLWKVTPQSLSLWSALLLRVPGSRLLLHSHEGPHRFELRRRFESEGVDPQRIEFVGFQPLPKYFEQYGRIDIALDPTPFCGGTTTLDALWMGVPVVSLAGRTAVSRGGLSILSNVGLPELVARDADEYLAIASELAGNLPRLVELRAGMRQRLRRSPLMDAPAFTRDFEALLRRMWRLFPILTNRTKSDRSDTEF